VPLQGASTRRSGTAPPPESIRLHLEHPDVRQAERPIVERSNLTRSEEASVAVTWPEGPTRTHPSGLTARGRADIPTRAPSGWGPVQEKLEGPSWTTKALPKGPLRPTSAPRRRSP
jgi:hypothetical protein